MEVIRQDDPVSMIVPTAQEGGNQIATNQAAGTAPGGEPATPFTTLRDEVAEHPSPVIDTSASGAVNRHLERGDGARDDAAPAFPADSTATSWE